MKHISEFEDTNGLITPQESWVAGASGNGMTYAVLAMILFPYYNPAVIRLWDSKRNILMRTPDNAFGQESHDNYTALAIYCLAHNEKWARVVLWSAIKKFGFMQNNFTEENAFWKSQMIRFPHIWFIMIASAFPNRVVFWITRNLLTAVIRSQKLNFSDASGFQLRFMLCHAVRMLGSNKQMEWLLNQVRSQGMSIVDVMKPYYSEGHPMIDGYLEYEKEVLNP
jgi:hypothetical protein